MSEKTPVKSFDDGDDAYRAHLDMQYRHELLDGAEKGSQRYEDVKAYDAHLKQLGERDRQAEFEALVNQERELGPDAIDRAIASDSEAAALNELAIKIAKLQENGMSAESLTGKLMRGLDEFEKGPQDFEALMNEDTNGGESVRRDISDRILDRANNSIGFAKDKTDIHIVLSDDDEADSSKPKSDSNEAYSKWEPNEEEKKLLDAYRNLTDDQLQALYENAHTEEEKSNKWQLFNGLDLNGLKNASDFQAITIWDKHKKNNPDNGNNVPKTDGSEKKSSESSNAELLEEIKREEYKLGQEVKYYNKDTQALEDRVIKAIDKVNGIIYLRSDGNPDVSVSFKEFLMDQDWDGKNLNTGRFRLSDEAIAAKANNTSKGDNGESDREKTPEELRQDIWKKYESKDPEELYRLIMEKGYKVGDDVWYLGRTVQIDEVRGGNGEGNRVVWMTDPNADPRKGKLMRLYHEFLADQEIGEIAPEKVDSGKIVEDMNRSSEEQQKMLEYMKNVNRGSLRNILKKALGRRNGKGADLDTVMAQPDDVKVKILHEAIQNDYFVDGIDKIKNARVISGNFNGEGVDKKDVLGFGEKATQVMDAVDQDSENDGQSVDADTRRFKRLRKGLDKVRKMERSKKRIAIGAGLTALAGAGLGYVIYERFGAPAPTGGQVADAANNVKNGFGVRLGAPGAMKDALENAAQMKAALENVPVADGSGGYELLDTLSSRLGMEIPHELWDQHQDEIRQILGENGMSGPNGELWLRDTDPSNSVSSYNLSAARNAIQALIGR